MHRRVLAVLFLFITLTLPAAAGIDRWTPIGPDTGIVRALAASPSRPATVYAGLRSGGVYRSVDGGTTWAFAGNGLDTRAQVTALAVDARLPDRVWAATDNVIYRTVDGGAHWFKVRDGGALALAADPRASGTVYAPLGDGPLQRSADGGATWQTLPVPVQDVAALAIDPSQPQNLYAGTRSGLFISRNRGASWQPSRRGLPASPLVLSLAIDPRSPRTVYLATSGVAPDQIVFRSVDGGASWTAIDGGMLGPTSQIAVGSGKQGGLWAVATGELFRSVNQGRTWSRVGTGLPEGEVIAVLPGATLLAGTGAGVFQSANRGASWSPSSQGILEAGLQGLALDPLRPLRLWAVDAASNVFRTTSGGERWTLLPPVPQSLVVGPAASDPGRPGTVYVGLLDGIAVSADAGNHWHAVPLTCFQPATIAVDPRDSSVVYSGGHLSETGCAGLPDVCEIFRSDDAGGHWSCIRNNLPASFTQVVVPDPFQAGTVYTLVAEKDLYRSTDRGASWSFLAPLPGIEALAADPHRAGRLWAGGGIGVERSDDGGQTWTPSGAGLPAGDHVVALALDPVDSNVAYAATSVTGVFRTGDGGATWDSAGPGLAGLDLGFLALDPRDRSTLYAGTRLRGVWKLQQSGD
jgi:photosystem II stability/assembly factor-like uncharacterized protein